MMPTKTNGGNNKMILNDFRKYLETTVELSPNDNRKSFYGKAKIIICGNMYYLLSYETIVASYNNDDNTFARHWHGYSATTMRHINAFMHWLGTCLGGKSWWDKLEIEKPYNLEELKTLYNGRV